MRPIKLTMQAFGPFKNQVVVDFEKFNQGLFLISGPTGSGKSSIFDGLAFALYNEASGANKDQSMFRSGFADDDSDTYVELEFSHFNSIYRIKRSPSYMKPKKRGDGYTTKSSSAQLYEDDVLISDGSKEVTTKIENLLGLKASQFKQIVMIAQGEFLDLLLTKSSDRVEIFRRIFDTEPFKIFQDKLKERFAAIKNDYQRIDVLVKQINSNYQTDYAMSDLKQYLEDKQNQYQDLYQQAAKTYSELNDSYTKMQAEFKVMEDNNHQLETLNTLNQQMQPYLLDIAKQQALKLEYQMIQKDYDDYGQSYFAYQKNMQDSQIAEVYLKQYQVQLVSHQSQLENQKEQLKALEAKSDEMTKYQSEITILKSLIDQYDVKDTLTSNYHTLKMEYQTLANQCQMTLHDIESSKNNISELSALIDNHKGIDLMMDEFDDLKNILKQIELTNLKFISVQKDFEHLDGIYRDYEKQFFQAQAGLLAQSLHDDEMCPVCGSTSHPKLAKMVDDKLSKELLDEKKLARDNAYQIYVEQVEALKHLNNHKDKIYHKYHIENFEVQYYQVLENHQIYHHAVDDMLVANQKYEELEIQSKTMSDKLSQKQTAMAKVESQIEQLNKTLPYQDKKQARDTLDNYVKIYQQYHDSLNTCQNKLNQLVNQQSVIQTNIDNQKANIEKYQLQIKTFVASIEVTKLEVIIHNINQYAKIKDDIAKNNQFINQYNLLKVKIEDYQNRLQDKQIVDLSDYQQQLLSLNNQVSENFKQVQNIKSDYDRFVASNSELDKIIKDNAKLQKAYEIIQPLADTANANLSGKARINFEIYVQMVYFKRVLEMANIRLMKMTANRYQLQLKEENNLRSISGLDIEVFDEWNMKCRDVKTLSGGESFKAALALAFGMSDVIEASSGGIQIDCVFIDEGFGTLDPEALNQALLILEDLVSNDRLVGIISHVEELKNRIDQKIIVGKSSTGSSINYRV